MTLLAPIGLAALALAIPIVILHMLTPRRPPTPVSSLLHWDGLRHAITAAEPWQRLRVSLLLILQLLAVLLFAVALARPAVVEAAALTEHTVFMVDASGSMAAIDGAPDRLGAAVDIAADLLEQIPEGGTASLVAVTPNPTVLVEATTDGESVLRALRSMSVSAGSADFEAGFALAEALASGDRPTGYVLVSDGALSELDQKLAPRGTRFESVGRSDTNRAITNLAVSAGPTGLEARITIESTGGPDAIQTLRLDVDGITAEKREITIPQGGVVEETFELPLGQRVAAYLEGEDLLSFDNQRYAAAPAPGSIKVRLYGDDSAFFVAQLLSAIPGIDLDPAPEEQADLEVYAGTAVPVAPEIPFIAIDAPGGAPGVTPVGRIDDPVPTLLADDQILANVDVSRIVIADAQVVAATSTEIILGAPGAPLLLRGQAGDVPFYYFTFTLEQSNLPVDIAFPIIGSRLVSDLTADEGSGGSLLVGDRLPLGGGGGSATDPRGGTLTIAPAQVEPIAHLAGFWALSRGDGAALLVAVNANTTESHLAPRRELPFLPDSRPESDEPAALAQIARSLLPWVIAAIGMVLAAELIASWRRRGVSRRQWYAGAAVRALIASLLVLSFVDPTFATRSDDVTTIFVVDISDSLGASGRATARAWVNAALADAGDAEWAIVEFGGDARVAVPLGRSPYDAAVGADGTATNLGRGLRVGQSLLDGETRERIVVVSDGRVTAGDLAAELERLAALGVTIDVHSVSGDLVTDAAIAAVNGPGGVGRGESYELSVEVLSTVTAPATVDLIDEGQVVATREVSLEPGANSVAFTIVAEETGIKRFEARVRIPGDAQPANDSNVVAVEVLGPASALVIEGSEGNGVLIADALISLGLEVERVPVTRFPPLEELSVHRAAVLVDVTAESISAPAIEALGSFVRDLGRGLVVVGGDQSFALGGYQNSELEALLPVDSEAQDTKREATVAEVLLIDTSESMGACHCRPIEGAEPIPGDPFGASEMIEGGPNKTDISRSAAARAIQALSANDEVGVLAFSGSQRWIIPLQQLPPEDVVTQGLGSMRPFGETRVIPALREAADALRQSQKELKHIILFTDGFTSELFDEGFVDPDFAREIGDLVEEAEAVAAEGITISVVATGEGAIPTLQKVAEVGGGRFYPGRDLNEIPEIFVKEARLAARTFINEGEYYPTVTSISPAVRYLASAPPLLGFVAATPKPTADVQLQIGEFADPLLSSWRIGLGKVTAWTSDGGDRWGAQWAGWESFADFWSALVRDTFPLAGAEGQGLRARIVDETLEIVLESEEPIPAGTTPMARVGQPDGTSVEIRLERRSDTEFAAVVPARQSGTYAVGVNVSGSEGDPVILSGIATRSFSAEYLPGDADTELMGSLSSATGGRGEITAASAFDPEGLEDGVRSSTFRWWFLLAAALLWPLDVAIRLLRLERAGRPHLRPPSSPHPPRPTQPADARTR